MKKFMLIILIICLPLAFAGCAFSPQASVELVETPDTIEDLIEMTSVIVRGTVGAETEKVSHKDLTYYLTEITVTEVLRDNNELLKEGDKIVFMQNEFTDIDPLVKAEDDMMLFLVKIDFPDHENTYRAIGLYKGKFVIKNDTLINKEFNDKSELTLSTKSVYSMIDTISFDESYDHTQSESDLLDEEAEEAKLRDQDDD